MKKPLKIAIIGFALLLVLCVCLAGLVTEANSTAASARATYTPIPYATNAPTASPMPTPTEYIGGYPPPALEAETTPRSQKRNNGKQIRRIAR